MSSAQSVLHFFSLHKEVIQWDSKWLSQNTVPTCLVLRLTGIWGAVTVLNNCKTERNFMNITDSNSIEWALWTETQIYSTSEHYTNSYHLKLLNMNFWTHCIRTNNQLPWAVLRPKLVVHCVAEMMYLMASPSLLTIILPSSILWHTWTSTECLSLAYGINMNIHMTGMARWWVRNAQKCVRGE